MDLQTAIFQAIIAKYPKKSQAVEAICKLFQLKQNAVYRRIRGQSPLYTDELALLVQHFQISVDAIIYNQSDKILFDYPALNTQPKDNATYLQNLANHITELPKLNGQIKYTAAELPLYHYCFFPEIIAFKLYTWGRTTWAFPHLQEQKFQLDLMSPSDIRAADDFLYHYLQIPSIELWNRNALDNTLNQIEHCAFSGNMTDVKEVFLLCDKMLELVIHLERMAEEGKKFPVGAKSMERRTSFTLFNNESIYTGNNIIVKTNLGNVVFSTFTNPNYLKTNHQRTVQSMENWFDNITTKSELISVHGEKSRQHFFNVLKKKIARTKSRIERFLEDDLLF